jgi:carboxymethylenebutenolidase
MGLKKLQPYTYLFMNTTSETIILSVPGELDMHAFVARPEPAGATHSAPGLFLFQEAYGVNEHIRDVAKRLAKEGYVTVAPELFHRTAPPGFESPYDDFTAVAPHFQALTPEAIQTDIAAAYDWLMHDRQVDPNRLGSIGFCLGGRVSYLANANHPLKAAISFYGGGISPNLLDRAKDQHGPILFFWGGLDQHIGPDHRDAITEAMATAEKPYVNVEFSFAGHAFFCDARKAYNPAAAKQAWPLVLAFLKSYL